MRLAVFAGFFVPLALVAAIGGAGAAGPSASADTTASSAEWLARLPDGAEKRQFIIDCTNCHQFDRRIATTPAGPRTRTQWVEAVQRMLGYAGASTGFPVMSAGRDAERTADWLTAALGDAPEPVRSQPRPAPAEVREFLFPADGDLPHDLAVEASGRVVVTGMFSHAMHLLDPASGQWTRVEIPVEKSNPRAIELDASGRWWVVLGGPNMLARYDGTEWRTWPVGMYAHSVALDSSGGAWVNGHFTRDPELLARIAPDGSIGNHELPRHPTMAAGPGGPIPYEIRTARDGAIWMSELQGSRIVRFDPATRRSRTFELPTSASGPRRLDIDTAGIVWIPAYGAGTLIRLDPLARAGSQVEEIALPVRDAAPYIARVHPRTGVVWVGTGTADAVLAYHPKERRFDYYPLPSRGANIRHLAFDPRSSDVWLAYGESPGKNPARIARLRPGAAK
jgi:streptogramin lyase